jgi:hypothetical protein
MTKWDLYYANKAKWLANQDKSEVFTVIKLLISNSNYLNLGAYSFEALNLLLVIAD